MKFIYLIQSNRGEIPYKIPPGADLLILQWQQEFQPNENSFHYPDSTWASGRNELFNRAITKGDYDYFIFLDDDLKLLFDLIFFEKLLEQYNFRRASPWFPDHPFYISPISSTIEQVKYIDHALMAVRSDCCQDLFPYTLQFDTQCWWLSSEDLCERFWNKWPHQTYRFNDLIALNKIHGPYPRKGYPGFPRNIVKPYTTYSQ